MQRSLRLFNPNSAASRPARWRGRPAGSSSIDLRSLRFITAAIFVASIGCKEAPSQAADAVVLDWVSPHLADADASGLELHADDVVVGLDENAPARLECTTALDAEGCRRVQRVKATRTGGATDFEIYESKVVGKAECFEDDFGTPGQVAIYDKVYVTLCYRWKGASNDDKCAYEESFSLRGDAVGLEWRGNASRTGKHD